MRKVSVKKRFSLRTFATTVLMGISLSIAAQEVQKEKTFSDGTRVTSTSELRFAKAGGWLSPSHTVAMSYVTFAEDGSSTYAIVMPLNINNRLVFPIGSLMTLYLQNGETMELPNVKVIGRGDNHQEFDRTFTVRPEYSIKAEQLEKLKELLVIKIRIESETEYIEMKKEDYTREWMFNSMVQRCYDVLAWKLQER